MPGPQGLLAFARQTFELLEELFDLPMIGFQQCDRIFLDAALAGRGLGTGTMSPFHFKPLFFGVQAIPFAGSLGGRRRSPCRRAPYVHVGRNRWRGGAQERISRAPGALACAPPLSSRAFPGSA